MATVAPQSAYGSLTSFIHKHYNAPVDKDFADTEIFFLADNLLVVGYRKVNALFIDAFGSA